MSDFTQGEWKVNKHYGCIYSGETLIARVADFSSNASTPETEANARLIVAAPEMYDLLNSICSYIHEVEKVFPQFPDALSMFARNGRELLARIDGEESDTELTI